MNELSGIMSPYTVKEAAAVGGESNMKPLVIVPRHILIDIIESEKQWTITADVPDCEKEDVNIELDDDNMVTISVKKSFSTEADTPVPPVQPAAENAADKDKVSEGTVDVPSTDEKPDGEVEAEKPDDGEKDDEKAADKSEDAVDSSDAPSSDEKQEGQAEAEKPAAGDTNDDKAADKGDTVDEKPDGEVEAEKTADGEKDDEKVADKSMEGTVDVPSTEVPSTDEKTDGEGEAEKQAAGGNDAGTEAAKPVYPVIHRKERASKFQNRMIQMPAAIVHESMAAKFSDGFLTITVDKDASLKRIIETKRIIPIA